MKISSSRKWTFLKGSQLLLAGLLALTVFSRALAQQGGGVILKTIIIDDYAPYTFVNAQGQPDGFTVDLVRGVARVMGFQVEIRVDTWAHAVEALESGQVDFLPMMSYSAERDQSFDFSPPHTIAYDALFTRKDSSAVNSLDDLTGKKIIVMENDQAYQYLMTIPSIHKEQLILVDSLPQALQRLAAGEGDAALMPKLVGLLLIRDLHLTDLNQSPVVLEAYDRPFSFAVRNGNQAVLERLNQGMRILKTAGQYDEIYNKWFGTLDPSGITADEFLKYLGWIALAFILTGLVFLLWLFSLRRQVAARTHSLELEVEDRKKAEEALRQSAFQNSAILGTALDGFWLIDPLTRRLLDVNDAYCRMSGYSREELLQMDISQFEVIERDADVAAHARRVMEHGADRFETVHRRRDGGTFMVDVSVQYLAQIGKMFAFIEDISERKQAEQALRQANDRLSFAQRSAGAGVWDWDMTTATLKWSPELFQLFGLDSAATFATFEVWRTVLHPDDRQIAEDRISIAIRDHVSLFNEYRIVMPSGEVRWIGAWGDTTYNEQGEALRMNGICIDITERKHGEDALRASEKNLRILFETMSEGIALNEIVYDANGEMVDYRILKVNQAFYGAINNRSSNAVGELATRLYGLSPEFIREFWKGHRGKTSTVYTEMISPVSKRYFFVSTSPFVDDTFVTSFFDITPRKEAEQALRESESRFRTYFELPLGGRAISSPEKGWLEVNDALCEMFGYTRDELLQMTWAELTHPEDVAADDAQFNRVLAGEIDGYTLEKRFIHKKGHNVHTHLAVHCVRRPDLSVDYFVTLLLDITERKQAESQGEALLYALAESETNLSTLIENTDGSIWAVDARYGLIVGNDEFHRNTSARLGRRLKKGENVLLPSFPKEANAEWQGYYDRALRGEVFNIETSTRFRAETRQVEYRFSPIRAASGGEIHGVTVYGRDISERRQAEQKIRESEEQLKAVIEGSRLGFSDWNIQTGRVYRNERWAGMLGYSLEEVESSYTQWTELVHPDDLAAARQSLQDHLDGKTPIHRDEYRMRARDGAYRWILDQGTVIEHDEQGRPLRMTATHTDITERKQMEEALRLSETALKKAQEVAHVGSWVWHIQTGQLIWSDEMYRIFGIKKDDFSGDLTEVVNRAIHPADRARVDAANLSVVNDGRSVPLEYRVVHPDGTVRTVWAEAGELILDNAGNSDQISGIVQDITERKQAESALRESEEKFRSMAELLPQIIFETDVSGQLSYVNKQAYKILGYPQDYPIHGLNTIDLYIPEDRPRAIENVRNRFLGRLEDSNEYTMQRRDGSLINVLVYSNPVFKDGKPCGLRGIIVDVTKLKQAEQERTLLISELQRSSAELDAIFKALPYLVSLHDREGRYLRVNPTIVSIFGFDPTAADRQDIAQRLKAHFPDGEPITLRNMPSAPALAGEVVENVEYIITDGAGNERTLLYNAIPLKVGGEVQGAVFAQEDITERKKAEQEIRTLNAELEQRVEERTRELRAAQEKLVRHEKLSVLGQMASSVGHELRNPLGVINSAVYYLKLVQPDADEKIKKYLDLIKQEVQTSEKIISDLLDFSRIKSVDREPAVVSELIGQTLLRFPLPVNINVTLAIPSGLPQVFVDPRQMVQVFGNLTMNACQAMEEGGQLDITAVVRDEFIAIAIKDTGIGIPPENIDKLFEPLFTTKPKGIGLGLAVCRKLIESNGGRIGVVSEVGLGSTFTVFLPIHR